MQSQSPFVLRHFIPFEFSKQAVDMKNSPFPKKYIVPKEDNPLQNMKLKALQKSCDPQFTLTFTNKTHKTYRARHSLQANRLLEQIQNQKLSTLAMFQQTQQQRPQKHNPEHPFSQGKSQHHKKNASLRDSPRQGRSNPGQNAGGSKAILRSKTCHKLPGKHPEHFKQEAGELDEYSCSLRNIRTASTGRLWRSSHLNHREKYQESPARARKLDVRGSRAPNCEVVDHLRRNSLKDLKMLWS